ncbi:MAG: 27 kDa antigen Cfp30B [Jatrophihabitans sp.]|jgi:predicted enzyme related to lactoylglutathione lyase|nr:27 kDa antigen Cfp30B [Jatrophihabitans sp.]MCW2658326.1 27 kDa antigen Cfp30B [Jatrophihabitans sp.]
MTVRDTPWAPGTPCWVDLMTTDQAAAQKFYGELFGWDLAVGGEDTGGYAMASIGGRAVAGIGGMMGMEHPPVWNTYLATADADATSDAVQKAGGTVMAPPMDVMDLGRMAFAQVPGGGVFSYWQAGTHHGAGIANEPNTLTWNEFLTRDLPTATLFYASVFDYTYTNVGNDEMAYSTIEVDGQTVGGIGALPAALPAEVPPHWRVYFAVEDADATVAKVSALGGTVLRPAMDMPFGRHADVADPQGAMFSVIKPTPQA